MSGNKRSADEMEIAPFLGHQAMENARCRWVLRRVETGAASGGDGSGSDAQVMVDGVAPIQAVMDGVAQVMRKESASSADGSFAQTMRHSTEQIIDLVENKDTADDAEKGEEKTLMTRTLLRRRARGRR